MKALKKISIILLVLIVILGAVVYIDYFLVKTNKSLPKISLKKEDKTKQSTIYNAIFYKVIKCDLDSKIIITDYKTSDDVCPREVTYDEDGYYTNSQGIKISKRDYKLMSYQNIYTFNTIDTMQTEEEVKNASYVALEYAIAQHKIIENSELDFEEESIELAVFQTMTDDYSFELDETNEASLYCTKLSSTGQRVFSKYDKEANVCAAEFKPIKMEAKWCKLYKYSTLVHSLDDNLGYCN